jgi:hypothetical protein
MNNPDTPPKPTAPEQPTDKGLDETACSALWEVQVKGRKCSSSWEISVIRKDNLHGHLSWGWFDNTKLLVSHNGGPCSWPIVEFVWDEQIRIAHELCAKLNSGEISLQNDPSAGTAD